MPRKLIFNFILFVILISLLGLIIELLARNVGAKPYQPYPFVIREIKPENFLTPDDTLGVKLKEGVFELIFSNNFSFTATHGEQGKRITRPSESEAAFVDKPKVWVLGGSISYGQSVADSLCFPWLLQEGLPDYNVVNFGGPGYSTIHALLQLERELATGEKPEIIVLTYGAFHDKRNTFNRDFQKNLHSNSGQIKELIFPYAWVDNQDSLQIGFKPFTYKIWPLMRYSAAVHYLEEQYNKNIHENSNSQYVSKKLIQRIQSICISKGIKLMVYALRTDHQTEEMMNYFEEISLPAKWITFDVKEPEYSLMPLDNHPNPLAHQKMAAEIYQLIERNRDGSDYISWEYRKQKLDVALAETDQPLDSIHLLRCFIAETVDIGMEATNIDSLYPDWSQLSISEFYDIFEQDLASANCGAISFYLQQLYAHYGFRSFRYNIGLPEGNLTHVTNLVHLPEENIYVVQDATFNFTLVDEKGKPIGFFDLLQKLKNRSSKSVSILEGPEVDTEIILPGNIDLNTFLGQFENCRDRIRSSQPAPAAYCPHQLVSNRDLQMLFACNPMGDQYLDMLVRQGYPRDFIYLFLMPNGKIDGPEAETIQQTLETILQN